ERLPSGPLAVGAMRIPTILEHLGWDRIGLLKMDIEGHERVLLTRNCEWLRLVDAVCLEYHDAGAEAKLGRIADEFGFRLPRLLPPGIWLLTRGAEDGA